MSQYALSYDEIEASLAAIVDPNSVFELRLLARGKKRVDGGYFDSIPSAATALSSLPEPHTYKGIYLTPNPVDGALLARAHNRIKPWIDYTTDDRHITRRRWLLIDIDAERPAGVSSTNLEHNRAISMAHRVAGMLEIEYGWPQPMINDSGNGAHILYPINEPNTEGTRDDIQAFLKALAGRFNIPGCKIDTSIFNAARIWRLPGTYARKGDSIPERPHRKASILADADPIGIVTLDGIREFTDSNPLPEGDTVVIKQGTGTNHEQSRYKRLNNSAMAALDKWVPAYFPGARRYAGGWRISSDELGRDREEDLTIHPYPKGIKDFGEHDSDREQYAGKRTPVSVIAEFHYQGDLAKAAEALAKTLNIPVSEFDPIEDKKDDYDQIFGQSFDFGSIKSFADLKDRTFAELKWIIPGVLPAGCFMLAARPKMRKTWLALQLSIAVATGGKFLDWRVNKGEALMLALEDNERRIKDRIETLHMFDTHLPDLAGFHYFTEAPFPRGADGCEVIRSYLDQNPNISLVVIDTFAHFREKSNSRDIYQRDYDAVMPITRLASEKQVCIIVVHHEKKGLAGSNSGDFLEDVSGSAGVTGGVDGVISIKGRRGVQEENESRKLMLVGRDIPLDFELDMSFDAERGGWLPAKRQDVATAIKAILAQHTYATQTELITLLGNSFGASASRVKGVLIDMKMKGEIEQNKFGYKLRH